MDTRISPDSDMVYNLSGIAVCADCGSPMTRKITTAGDKKYAYYICSNHKLTKQCSQHSISVSLLEDTVLEMLKLHIKNVMNLEEILDYIGTIPFQQLDVKSLEARKQKKLEEVEKCKRLKTSLYEDMKDGILTKEEYLELHEAYLKKAKEGEEIIRQIERDIALIFEEKDDKHLWMNYFTEYKDIKELTRDVVVKLISEVRVSENKEIEIVFDFDDCYKKLLESVEKLGYQVDKETGWTIKYQQKGGCVIWQEKAEKYDATGKTQPYRIKRRRYFFKAGLYARLSHEKEENIERGTIETQMELMKNYVKDHEDIVIEEEYYDASFTGTNFERPDFKRMLEDAKTGRINCIIVKDLSRLGRNYVEMGNYIERVFPFLNVRFIAVTDDFDSFRPGTDLMMPLKNIVNEFYTKDISKKVSTAHRRKWTTDEYMCGFAPYGYLKSKTEKNRIVVDEATAGNVRLIYKLFLDGKGYTPIAKYLNEQGIMSPLMYLKSLGYQQNVRTNGVWTKTTVKSILTNQAYIGSAVHGKVVIEKYNNIPLHATDPSEWVVVENTHEPLIDKKTFEKAQERVKEISDAYFAKEFTKHPPNEKNLLKGKIVCGDCGKGMRLSPRTTKSYVYFCGTFSDGINPACSRHKIDQEEVNKAVFAQISNHMRCCIDALKVIRELNARSSGLKKLRCV